MITRIALYVRQMHRAECPVSISMQPPSIRCSSRPCMLMLECVQCPCVIEDYSLQDVDVSGAIIAL